MQVFSTRCEDSGYEGSPEHQPVLVYPRDPYLPVHSARTSTSRTLPSTVTKGVLTALYDQDFRMPS